MFKILAVFIEVLNWIRIALSPMVLAAIIGLLVYASNPNRFGMGLAIGIEVIGFVIGAIWATRVWIKRGTSNFMASTMASPDIDEAVRPKEKSERPK
ncbi:MAG: hypothetical protein ACOVO3_05985 [Fluviicola sp.]|jgi:hypothetical protein